MPVIAEICARITEISAVVTFDQKVNDSEESQ